MKAPLFDWTLGRALPASGHANADDLQDLLILYLEQCKAGGGELYAFSAKFDRNLHKPIDAEFGNTDGLHGIHDIHLNQANVGAHAEDNGRGTTAVVPPIESLVDSWPSRPSASRPIPPAQWPPGARPLSRIISSRPGPPVATSTVYLERADQPGRLRPGPRSRRHRQLCDHQPVAAWVAADRPQRPRDEVGRRDPRRASTIVVLDGTGVQLGNNGGNLVLQGELAHQVDSVTSSAKDAAAVDRYIRFQQ